MYCVCTCVLCLICLFIEICATEIFHFSIFPKVLLIKCWCDVTRIYCTKKCQELELESQTEFEATMNVVVHKECQILYSHHHHIICCHIIDMYFMWPAWTIILIISCLGWRTEAKNCPHRMEHRPDLNKNVFLSLISPFLYLSVNTF